MKNRSPERRSSRLTEAQSGTAILHSPLDEAIAFAESVEPSRNSGLSEEALIAVGTDHCLAGPGPLRIMLEVCERGSGRRN